MNEIYFNSSMVRLEVCWTVSVWAARAKFQFQYGAIRGKREVSIMPAKGSFQFQYGAIRGGRTQ